MSWARGLFRLWVVFAVLWVGWIISAGITTGEIAISRSTFQVEGPFKERYDVSAPSKTTEAEIAAFIERHKRTDCSATVAGPRCAEPVALAMPAPPFPVDLVKAALALPLALLAIGTVLGWAFAGFKRSPHGKS